MAAGRPSAEQTAETAGAPGGDTARSHRGSKRHRKHSRSDHRCRAKIRKYQYLLAGITTMFLLVYIFTWLHIAADSGRHKQSLLQMRKLENTVQGVTTELEKVRSERDELVRGRIPHLLPLVYDQALDIDSDHIRNVIFTLARNGSKTIYEYRLVLSNNGLSVIRPKIDIFLFNELGIQIGNAEVQARNATTNIDRMTLEPGEVRSYSDTIKMLRKGQPAYFLIHTRHAGQDEEEDTREQASVILPP